MFLTMVADNYRGMICYFQIYKIIEKRRILFLRMVADKDQGMIYYFQIYKIWEKKTNNDMLLSNVQNFGEKDK